MTLGSPTSPKLASGAQFLPGFLMGDLPAPATPQPRPFNLTSPLAESTGTRQMNWEDTYPRTGCVLFLVLIYKCFTSVGGGGGGGSAPQPVVPTPKDKSGAPPVRSIHDDLVSIASPLNAQRQVSAPSAVPQETGRIQAATMKLISRLLFSCTASDRI